MDFVTVFYTYQFTQTKNYTHLFIHIGDVVFTMAGNCYF